MWTCETCGTPVGEGPGQGSGVAEKMGRTFFGLGAGARLCPYCLEGVHAVGRAVCDVQQPGLCSACRVRVERTWAAALPARPGARASGEAAFALPSERTGRSAPSVTSRST
jgi:hypothetical protein